MKSAKQQGNDMTCNIEWEAWREAAWTEFARSFRGGQRCALDKGSDERE